MHVPDRTRASRTRRVGFAALASLVATVALVACTVECVCDDGAASCDELPQSDATASPDAADVGADGLAVPDQSTPDGTCPLTCPDAVTCVVDDDGAPLSAACDAGVFRMAPLVRSCGFADAVALALADDCGGRFDGPSARVLWFEAGVEYVVDRPVVIEAPGVEVRGDGAPVYAVDPPDPRRQGTVFRCAVPKGVACVTLARRPESNWRSGFLWEGITLVWETSADAPDPPDPGDGADAVGLLVQNAEDVVVRDAVFEDVPGIALATRGVAWSRFADLVFVSPGETGGTALAFSCGPADAPGQPSVCPNGNVISGIHVEGYAVGVHYVSGNAVTIEGSAFTNSRRNAILADGVEALSIRGCRFMDVQEAPSEDAAYIRIQREDGWWYPDVVLDGVYFQCHCREGRWPVAASIGGTSATPVGRVAIRGSTFQNCPEGVLSRGDPRTLWQCSDNRVLQKVSASPTRYETWPLEDCATDDALPPQPDACFD